LAARHSLAPRSCGMGARQKRRDNGRSAVITLDADKVLASPWLWDEKTLEWAAGVVDLRIADSLADSLCEGCPPAEYPNAPTRCSSCPRRTVNGSAAQR
jgi:hypothetical protein